MRDVDKEVKKPYRVSQQGQRISERVKKLSPFFVEVQSWTVEDKSGQ